MVRLQGQKFRRLAILCIKCYTIPMHKSYRILSVEGADIYKAEMENGAAVGVQLLERSSDACFRLFKVFLDHSLDSAALEKAYTRVCRKRFSFADKYGNAYTLAVVNVKFNYVYKPEGGKPVNLKALREHFYTNGFCVNGVHYVRYKRSAGSSREGKCLFIDERLSRAMNKWSDCGLKAPKDLVSWESYKALSLSSIKGTVEIPLEGILFVPDLKSTFTEEVVSVEIKDGALCAEQKQAQITNDIWDGESLLDESLFAGDYADKHMLLLRNKFFKSCGFRTKLQKWFADKEITLDDLKARGFVTLAEDIAQIVMVTTPDSLKYLKFAGGLSEKDIKQWAAHTDGTFGVVKWDQPTRFFHGKMVQSSIDYITLLRKDSDFMRYHFSDAFAREKDGDEAQKDGLAERADVIFTLLHNYPNFNETALYANFRSDVVRSLKERLKRGHILLNGTNATLFGNGTELLKYLAGEQMSPELQPGQVRCERFADGAKLLCARSPHITMGNLYCAENALGGEVWSYFDLGENIVCVNAIGENIQQRLNGCDYDSDTMLITDDALLVSAAERYNGFFRVPVGNIQAETKTEQTLAELDHDTSVNKIGEIVNLSQKLNSILWDELHHGADEREIRSIYEDICKLAVLSGLEIDKAKRTFENVRVSKELTALRKKYARPSPQFFAEIDERKDRQYAFYHTAMDYLYAQVKKLHFRKGREQYEVYRPISSNLAYDISSGNATEYRHKDKIVQIIDESKAAVNHLYQIIRTADEQEREVLYAQIADIKAEHDKQVARWLTNENVLILVLRHYEKNSAADWRIYAALINHPIFSELLWELYDGTALQVVEDENGEYTLYGRKFTKIYRKMRMK